MHSYKSNLLVGASALLAAAACAAPASAQVTINSAGSSLIAPYIAQAEGCYTGGTGAAWYKLGATSSTNNALQTLPSCSAGTSQIDSTDTFQDLSSSSGNGIGTFLSQSPATFDGPFGGSTWSSFTFGLSDAALTSDQISIYSAGSPPNHTFSQWGSTQTVTLSTSGSPPTGDFTAPGSTAGARGALIQFPVSVDPVALAYNPKFPTGSGSQSFNIHTNSGFIELSASAYCGIFTGAITTWDNSTLTGLNQTTGNTADGVSLTGTYTNVPIHLVGRSDSSGTTNIFTRHMATVCGSTTANPYYNSSQGTGNQLGSTTLPSGVTSIFTTEAGSGGVADEINNNAGYIGYIGPDYTSAFTSASGATSDVINAAYLINRNNTGAGALEPNGTNATTAFNVSPPSNANAGSAINWVPTTSIADPSSGYPMIGTTNALFYTVYDSSTVSTLTTTYDPVGNTGGFLSWYYTTTDSDTILSNVGLAPLPSAWKDAIDQDFIDPTDPNSLGLTIHS